MANTSQERRDKPLGHPHAKPSIWEHAAGVAGATIVVATLAFMAYEALTTPTGAVPQLAVRVDTVVSYSNSHVVEFRAMNAGDATASDVQIEGELRADTGVVERSEATIAFVPAQSWRRGGLVFKGDPSIYRLQVRVVGFDRP
jgi:uncharacterized protein (TIGR02588 family)